jgi:hypothetical protein
MVPDETPTFAKSVRNSICPTDHKNVALVCPDGPQVVWCECGEVLVIQKPDAIPMTVYNFDT